MAPLRDPCCTPDPDPLALADTLLRRTGHALATGDFARFQPCFHLPQWIETPLGRRLIETAEDMRRAFDAVRAHFRDSGITLLDRRVVRGARLAPDLIEAVHRTRLTHACGAARAPFEVVVHYRRVSGIWRIAGNRYDFCDAPAHTAALMVAGRPA
jgi:hypothetical protein